MTVMQEIKRQKGKPRKRSVINAVALNPQAKVVSLRNAPPISRPSNKMRGTFLSGDTWNPRAEMLGYFRCLADPENFPPVRLGGETMIQTALTTLHTVIPYSATTSSASLVIHPRLWAPVLVSETPGATGGFNNASYIYRTLGGFPASTVTTLQSLAAAARVVSMKVKIYSTSSATSDNGALTIGLCPRDPFFQYSVMFEGPLTGTTPSSTTTQFPGRTSTGGYPIRGSADGGGANQGFAEFSSADWSDTVPLKDGASCFWLPEDPQSMIFMDNRLRNEATYFSVGGQFDPASVNPSTVASTSQINDSFVCAGLTGMTPNGSSSGLPGSNFNIEIFLNLEYTVTSGAANVVETSAGTMSSTQAFSVVKKIGGNLQNTVVPSPEGSLADKAIGLGKSILKGGLHRGSEFLFGSSDVGDRISDLLF